MRNTTRSRGCPRPGFCQSFSRTPRSPPAVPRSTPTYRHRTKSPSVNMSFAGIGRGHAGSAGCSARANTRRSDLLRPRSCPLVLAWKRSDSHLATCRSHSFAVQEAGLLHPGRELSFVELVVLTDVEVAHFLALG